jgi:transcriptional regulator with XRE-family HTH domain
MSEPSELTALLIVRLGPRSAAELARTLGISRSYLSRLLTGSLEPDDALLRRLAVALRRYPGERPPVREVARCYWAGRVRWLRERLEEAERRRYPFGPRSGTIEK